jgi:hypothetical protein
VSSARERRNRQNIFTLIGALLASLGIVLVVVLISVRPDPTSRAEIDWHTVHNDTPNPVLFVDPVFSESDGDWWSNRADYLAGQNPEWYIGFVSPTNGFVAIHQFTNGLSPEVAESLNDVAPLPVVIDGSTWTHYDRSALETPGNYRNVYQITLPSGGILIVSGTANVNEIELVASLALDSVSVQVTGKG